MVRWLQIPWAMQLSMQPQVRLDAMAKAKEDALTIPQQILDEDTKKFEEYLQDLLEVECAWALNMGSLLRA